MLRMEVRYRQGVRYIRRGHERKARFRFRQLDPSDRPTELSSACETGGGGLQSQLQVLLLSIKGEPLPGTREPADGGRDTACVHPSAHGNYRWAGSTGF